MREQPTYPSSRIGRRLAMLAAAAGLVCAALSPALLPVQAKATVKSGLATAAACVTPPCITPLKFIGGPAFAGLYGWGAATLKDGSVLIGDYWNFRIQHYS